MAWQARYGKGNESPGDPLNGLNIRFTRTVTVFFIMLATGTTLAQELVPRRWSHLPIDTNFVGVGYAYTKADIAFDPVLQIEDAKLDMYTVAFSYIRTAELLGQSARVEVKIPFQDARWKGLLEGQPATAHRRGMADPMLRVAINLLGGPPLKAQEFAAYRAEHEVETTLGLGLVVQFPFGEYYEDKLLNLGSNRFTFRPQLGVEHRRGNWTAELTASTWFFTDNDSFLGDLRREQDPFFTVQSHLTYNFTPGFWASMSGGLGYGGESTIDGVEENDEQSNAAWALSVGYSLSRQFGLKFSYVGLYNYSDVGTDSDSLLLGASFFW